MEKAGIFCAGFALILFAPIIIWAGMRGDFQDTGLYRELFTEMPSALSGMNEYLQTVDKDLGFSVFSIILKKHYREQRHLILSYYCNYSRLLPDLCI